MSTLSYSKAPKGRRERGPVAGRGCSSFARRKVRVRGWSVGFNKVATTNLLRNYCGYGLKQAKSTVDEILSGDPVEIYVPEHVDIEAVRSALGQLGATVVVPKRRRQTYHVAPEDGAWAVRAEGQSRAAQTFRRKADAVSHARHLAREKRVVSRLVIHDRTGAVQREHVYGDDGRAPAPQP